jgi:hypothetical protein
MVLSCSTCSTLLSIRSVTWQICGCLHVGGWPRPIHGYFVGSGPLTVANLQTSGVRFVHECYVFCSGLLVLRVSSSLTHRCCSPLFQAGVCWVMHTLLFFSLQGSRQVLQNAACAEPNLNLSVFWPLVGYPPTICPPPSVPHHQSPTISHPPSVTPPSVTPHQSPTISHPPSVMASSLVCPYPCVLYPLTFAMIGGQQMTCHVARGQAGHVPTTSAPDWWL